MTPTFLFTELKLHWDLKNRIAEAEQYFKDKNYLQAMQLYSALVSQYKSFNEARRRVIQSCFALAQDEPGLYEHGLSYVYAQQKFKDSEIEELAYYLPTDQKKAEFRSIFVKA